MSEAKPKSKLEAAKDLVAISRDLLILVIVILLFLIPSYINDVLVRAGFEEGSFVGMKWKAGLAKSDQALKEAQTTIGLLTTQLDSVKSLLVTLQPSIRGDSLKTAVQTFQRKAEKLATNTRNQQAILRSTISDNAALVKQAQLQADGSSWGVVLSADATLEEAKYEQRIAARKFQIEGSQVYLRAGTYRTVRVVLDRGEADAIAARARQRYPDAYVVVMQNWCNSAEERAGYFECKNGN